MKPFAVNRRELGPKRVAIEISGELDMAVADRVKAELRAAMAENDEIVVLLAGCEFIDSTGIASLVLARNAFAGRGGRMVLCQPIDQVRRVLTLSGLAEDGVIFDDLDSALSHPASG